MLLEKRCPPKVANHARPSVSKAGETASAVTHPPSGPIAAGAVALNAYARPDTKTSTGTSTQEKSRPIARKSSDYIELVTLEAWCRLKRGPVGTGVEGVIMRYKIGIVGAGNVGGTTAQRIAERNYANIVLLDIPAAEGIAKGKALDIQESGPVLGYDTKLTGGSNHADLEDCDVVVVTAGSPRKPGMSRDDLVAINTAVMNEWGGAIREFAPGAIVIVVTNPLDAMAQAVFRATGFPRERILGMAGVLDSARFRSFIASELRVSVSDVTAFVLGGHGDTMVPLARYSTVAGVPLPELLPAETIAALAERTANGGAEIVNLLQSGSAFYAPSASVLAMVDSIILDQRRVLPCSVYLDGEYGYHDVFMGVPVTVGAGGVEEIVQIDLTEEEKSALDRSAESVQELLAVMNDRAGVGR